MITTTLGRNAFSLCRIARAPRPNPSATKFSGKEETGNERCAEEDFSRIILGERDEGARF